MVRFKHYAQLQHYKGWTVEFQPDHLLCDRCWELTSTAVSYTHLTLPTTSRV